jgi:hypothetical protein
MRFFPLMNGKVVAVRRAEWNETRQKIEKGLPAGQYRFTKQVVFW